jgi:hypothetical protein
LKLSHSNGCSCTDNKVMLDSIRSGTGLIFRIVKVGVDRLSYYSDLLPNDNLRQTNIFEL